MSNSTSVVPFLETEYNRFEIKDNILYITYKKGITLTLDTAKQIVKDRMQFAANKSYRVIVRDEGMTGGDKSTRDYFSNEGTEGIIAGAFIIKSVYSTFLFNFYLSITNPKIPSRTFTDEKKALKWLEQYKVKT